MHICFPLILRDFHLFGRERNSSKAEMVYVGNDPNAVAMTSLFVCVEISGSLRREEDIHCLRHRALERRSD